MKKLRIGVIEDNREYWIELVKIVEGLGEGYEVEAILFCSGDTLMGLAKTIRQENLDIILLDESLSSQVKGPLVLREAGGEWFKPGIAGGNPKVISVSSDPTKEMLNLSCASFTKKHSFFSFALAPAAKQELINIILAAAARVRAL